MAKKITEADRRAKQKYINNKTKIFAVRFILGQDDDIIEFLNDSPNKTDAIRQALKDAMKKN